MRDEFWSLFRFEDARQLAEDDPLWKLGGCEESAKYAIERGPYVAFTASGCEICDQDWGFFIKDDDGKWREIYHWDSPPHGAEIRRLFGGTK